MRNLVFIATLFFIAPISIGQVIISDSLEWTATSPVTSQTSPDFDFCDQTLINYTLSTTSSGGFQNITSTSNNSIPNGAIFPALTSSNSELDIPITINFSQTIDRLWIKIVDLDEDHDPFIGDPEEYLHNFSIVPDTVVDIVGNFIFDGSNIDPDGNNTSGWLGWYTNLNSLSFTYHKPGTGYGLVISEIRFGCDTSFIVTPPPSSPTPPPVQPPLSQAEPEIPCEGINLFVPNVITPNSDHLNDFMTVELDPCWEIEQFSIINRWGNQVIKIEEAPIFWDGTDKLGRKLAEGTYFWVFEYTIPDIGHKKAHGFITLAK